MKLILFVLVVGALAASAATNLLDQPGFEGTYTNGVAPGWKKFAIRGTARGSLLESTNAHAGAKAQLLQLDEQLDGWFQCSAPIRGGLAAGHDYEARVWLKGDRFLHQLALVTHDKTDWFPTDYAAYWRPISNDWTELVMRFRASTTDTNAQFGIRLNQEGKLWIDDAALYELTAADQPADVADDRRQRRAADQDPARRAHSLPFGS